MIHIQNVIPSDRLRAPTLRCWCVLSTRRVVHCYWPALVNMLGCGRQNFSAVLLCLWPSATVVSGQPVCLGGMCAPCVGHRVRSKWNFSFSAFPKLITHALHSLTQHTEGHGC